MATREGDRRRRRLRLGLQQSKHIPATTWKKETWIKVKNQDTMADITTEIHKELGIKASEYWTTYHNMPLPKANDTRIKVGGK